MRSSLVSKKYLFDFNDIIMLLVIFVISPEVE